MSKLLLLGGPANGKHLEALRYNDGVMMDWIRVPSHPKVTRILGPPQPSHDDCIDVANYKLVTHRDSFGLRFMYLYSDHNQSDVVWLLLDLVETEYDGS